jgi:hypothetical protein
VVLLSSGRQQGLTGFRRWLLKPDTAKFFRIPFTLLDVIYRIVYGLFVNLYKLSIYKYIPEAT